MCDSVVSCSVCEETLGVGTIVCGRCAAKKYGTQPTDVQQLKAEIAAISAELLLVYKTGSDEYVVSVINKLRQLSAV